VTVEIKELNVWVCRRTDDIDAALGRSIQLQHTLSP
jgi:hypothetical protein